MFHRFSLLLLSLTLMVGCAHSTIPGTNIEDTEDNRSVLQVLDQLQKALQARDADTVISLISPTYFEDMGTIDNKDDFGFEEFKASILNDNIDKIAELYLKIDVHDVQVEGDQAFIDIRYRTRAKLVLPSGSTWTQDNDFSRVIFSREEGRWLVSAGL
jgi:ketosteroid isomerase-like protein